MPYTEQVSVYAEDLARRQHELMRDRQASVYVEHVDPAMMRHRADLGMSPGEFARFRGQVSDDFPVDAFSRERLGSWAADRSRAFREAALDRMLLDEPFEWPISLPEGLRARD